MLGDGEQASVGLFESGVFALGGDFSDDGGVDRRSGGFAVRLPISLGRGRFNDVLGIHRRARFGQNLRGGVQSRHLAFFLGRGGLLGLWRFLRRPLPRRLAFLRVLLRCGRDFRSRRAFIAAFLAIGFLGSLGGFLH